MKKLYNIQWSATSLDNLEAERYAQAFMLIRNGRVLYIGSAFHRDLQTHISRFVQTLQLDSGPVEIVLGRVVEFSGLEEKDLEEMLRAMVYAMKPRFNLQGKRDYKPSGEMTIQNRGYALLPENVRTNKWGVYVSRRKSTGISVVA